MRIFCYNGTCSAGVAHPVERHLAKVEVASSSLVTRSNKNATFVYQTNVAFLSDAFLAERDAHLVRDAGFTRGARLRRVRRTLRITYHIICKLSESAIAILLLPHRKYIDRLFRGWSFFILFARLSASGVKPPRNPPFNLFFFRPIPLESPIFHFL